MANLRRISKILAASIVGSLINIVSVSADAQYGGTGNKILITDEMREEYTSDFVAFDSDRNNLLDAQEVTANFQGQVKPREMYEFFRAADKNSDGKVSLMEYVDYAADLTAENKADL